MLKSNSFFQRFPIKSKYLYVIFVTLFLYLFVLSAEKFFKFYINKNWKEIAIQKESEFESELKSKFIEYQKSLQYKLERLREKIKLYGENNIINQAQLFDILDSINDESTSIILFDSTGRLIAWSNPFIQTTNLKQPILTRFFISKSNVYKYLNLESQIKVNKEFTPNILISRLLDQNFFLSSRFIQPNINRKIFPQEFKRDILLVDNLDKKNENRNYKTIQLFSIDNTPLIFVQYYPLNIDDIFYELESYFKIIKIFLLVFLISFIIFVTIELIKGKLSTPIKEILLITELWLFRYLLLWIGFPTEVFDSSIFNPSYFASSFGYGIAKSTADFLITSIILFISVRYLSNISNYIIDNQLLKPKLWISKFLFVFISFIIILILFRGYIATLISAIQDSNLNYYQQTEIVPSLEKIVMFISLIFITLSFLTIGLIFTKYAINVLKDNNRSRPIIILLISLLAVFVFVILHPNPLFSYFQGLFFILALLLLSLKIQGSSRVNFNSWDFIVIVVISAFLLTYFFNLEINIDREQKLVDLANQITQPFDDWMAFIVDEALNEVSRIDLEKFSLLQKNEDIAFNIWANSILSQKGYDCRITILDTSLQILSKFSIGSLNTSNQILDEIPRKKIVKVNEIKTEGGEIKYYTGYSPIYKDTNKIIGAIVLDVTASRSELLSQYNTNILIAGKYERDYYFFKSYYNEFKNGYLSYSTNPEFSKSFIISPEILANLENGNTRYYYVKEKISDKLYHSVYLKDNREGKIVSVSVEIPGWKKFEIFRLFIHVIFISLFLIIICSLNRLKNIFQLSFFAKLFLVFILISIIPLFVFGYYNNLYTKERMYLDLKSSLQREAELIIRQLTKDAVSEPNGLLIVTDEICEEISKKTGVDFIFYSNALYSGSSLSEFIKAELINKVISEGAYKKIVNEGREFFTEVKKIGSFDYLAGYKPVFDYSGNFAGIISVLTISKISWLDSEIAHRNMYMFGVYFIVFVFVFIIGYVFSNQLSKPLKNLLKYTKLVGSGNLDVRINSKRSDEIGELENAFDKMTADLKQKREELVKYEKELAWKEMAKQVAHEIKNPLTPIKLSIQQLYKAYKDGAKNFDEIFSQAYNMIIEQIETLSRIASEFSHFARMPVRKLEKCSIHELLDETIQLYNQYPEIIFVRKYFNEDLKVIADKDELRRAFVNIVRNSVQAIQNNGRIELITEKINEQVWISFVDNGPGIPEEISKRIFEPNFSTKSEGMGLGLAIVKKTVEDLNGEITFTTKIGEGTKFVIKLNLAKDE